MPRDAQTRIIPVRTPQSRQFARDVDRARALSERINRLGWDQSAEITALFEEMTGAPAGEHFRLAPPFFVDCGRDIRVGARVFINQNCTFYSLAPITLGDDVLIGPGVSLITSEHPVAPSRRRAELVGRPITVGNGVWIAAGATVIGGVSIGDNAVVAAGSVVTRDVPADTLVAGNPARVIRSIAGE